MAGAALCSSYCCACCFLGGCPGAGGQVEQGPHHHQQHICQQQLARSHGALQAGGGGAPAASTAVSPPEQQGSPAQAPNAALFLCLFLPAQPLPWLPRHCHAAAACLVEVVGGGAHGCYRAQLLVNHQG